MLRKKEIKLFLSDLVTRCLNLVKVLAGNDKVKSEVAKVTFLNLGRGGLVYDL